jgi:hypothetical protein
LKEKGKVGGKPKRMKVDKREDKTSESERGNKIEMKKQRGGRKGEK